MADEWNLNKPVNSTLISDLPLEHRRRKTNVAAVLEKEHATLGDSNTGGEHKQGSAVMWHLSTANIPALQPDGTALASSDNGRLWHDITTDIIYVLDDYNDPTIGGGWIAIGHYLGDIAINTDKFTVARATGNTDIDGTLDVVGDFNPTTFASTNGGFLDEDAMDSNDATAVASQQSIKAYIAASRTTAGKVEADDSTVFNTTMTSANTFQDLDLSTKVGSNVAWVYLEIVSTGGGSYACKPKGEGSGTFSNHIETGNTGGGGASSARLQNGNYRYLLCQTDSSGVIQHGYTDNSDTLTIKLLTFIK